MVTWFVLVGIGIWYLIALWADWSTRDGSRIAPKVVWYSTAAGVSWQTAYLIVEAQRALGRHAAPLSGWHHWCLIAAWGIAVAFIILHWQRARASVGVFILPLVIGLVVIAGFFSPDQLFPAERAGRIWGVVHGLLLLLGTVIVTIGFAAGVMYLVQSRRLKQKQLPGRGIRLPSLEWLQNVNERSLLFSSLLLGGGLLAGIILNAVHHSRDEDPLPWSDPVVVTSGALFLWLMASCFFNWVYRPARVGRKVAYLTVASFIFLAIALAMTLFGPSSHATSVSRELSRNEVWIHRLPTNSSRAEGSS
jgi:ABC-type uncharacterized transport system permease subunit